MRGAGAMLLVAVASSCARAGSPGRRFDLLQMIDFNHHWHADCHD
jgi:hypothetical protein